MRAAVASVPLLALLFIAAILPTNAQSEAGAGEAAGAGAGGEGAGGEGELVTFMVGRALSIRCSLPNDKAEPYVWMKNGTSVDEWADVRGRYVTEQGGAVWNVSGRAQEDDYGNYSCGVGGARQAFRVVARPHVKLDHNTNVVEGQKLKIVCKVLGKPYPAVRWTYSNASDAEDEGAADGADAAAALGERVTFDASDAGVPNGVLVIQAAKRSDYGRYTCVADASQPAGRASTVVRVKDMYAALWPFLGICGEVVVLCAVILLYERRRAKPELEDSDTDAGDAKKS